MNEITTQNRRLDFLVEAFKAESEAYSDLQIPHDTEGKQRLLRSLMNIRMPEPIPEEILCVQDEYLTGRAGKRDRSAFRYSGGQRRIVHLEGGHHAFGLRCHRERGQYTDARVLHPDAYLH